MISREAAGGIDEVLTLWTVRRSCGLQHALEQHHVRLKVARVPSRQDEHC